MSISANTQLLMIVLMDSKCLGTSGPGTVHKMRSDGVGSSAGYDWGQST